MEFTDQFDVVWRGAPLDCDRRGRTRVRFVATTPDRTNGWRPMTPVDVALAPRALRYRGWFRRAVCEASDWWVQPR